MDIGDNSSHSSSSSCTGSHGPTIILRCCWQVYFIFLHPASATGVIVLARSVCVCLALTGEQTNIRTWNLVWRSSGRISRSSLKVIGQGHQVKNVFSVRCIVVIQQQPGSAWCRWSLAFCLQDRSLCGIQFHIRMLGLRRWVFSKRLRFFIWTSVIEDVLIHVMLPIQDYNIYTYMGTTWHCDVVFSPAKGTINNGAGTFNVAFFH